MKQNSKRFCCAVVACAKAAAGISDSSRGRPSVMPPPRRKNRRDDCKRMFIAFLGSTVLSLTESVGKNERLEQRGELLPSGDEGCRRVFDDLRVHGVRSVCPADAVHEYPLGHAPWERGAG